MVFPKLNWSSPRVVRARTCVVCVCVCVCVCVYVCVYAVCVCVKHVSCV